MLIDSPELAQQVAAKLDASFANCWQVDLRGKRMIWQGVHNGKPEIWTSDPEISGWRRFKCGVLGLLPIEDGSAHRTTSLEGEAPAEPKQHAGSAGASPSSDRIRDPRGIHYCSAIGSRIVQGAYRTVQAGFHIQGAGAAENVGRLVSVACSMSARISTVRYDSGSSSMHSRSSGHASRRLRRG